MTQKTIAKKNARPYIIVWCLVFGFIPAISHAKKEPKLEDHKIAELIRTHLSYRYTVEEYALNLAKATILGTFTLKDGQKLTYAPNGALLTRTGPGGTVTTFQNGYPVKTTAFPDKLIRTTRYKRDGTGQIKESITKDGNYKLFRYYHKGDIDLEIQISPKGMMFRRGFHFSPAGHLFSYFETNAKTGMTDKFVISLDTGLVQEQWRVTGGIARNWLTRYRMLMHLISKDFKAKYSDPLKLRRDSFNRTKGDLLLNRFKAKQVFPVTRFSKFYKNDQIKFDKGWKHVDCFDIVLTFPQIDLVQIEKQVIEPVVVKGHTVYQWIEAKKKWQLYPFDATVEKLVPVGMGGEAKIIPKHDQFQWQYNTTKYEDYIIDNRFIIKDEDIAQLKKQLANIDYYRIDPDDFQMMITETKGGKIQAVARHAKKVKVDIGKPLGKLNKELIEIIQMEVLQLLKVQWYERPELQQRDELQRTQAEYMMHINQAQRVLPVKWITRQRKKLFLKQVGMHDVLTLKNVNVRLPVVVKKKSIKIIDKVKLERGNIKVWEPDEELREKGYWRHYVLRPERDVLIQEQDRLQIKVDDGRFRWFQSGQWLEYKVSGKVYLSRYLPEDKKGTQSTDVEPKESQEIVLQDSSSQAGMHHPSRPSTPKRSWKSVIKRLIKGEEVVVHEKKVDNNQTITTTDYRNRFGQLQRYQNRIEHKHGWYEAFFDREHRLLSFKNQDGLDFRLVHGESGNQTGTAVIVDKVTDDLVDRFYYLGNTLQSVTYTDDSKQLITSVDSDIRVQYQSRLGKPVFTKQYGIDKKIKEMHFANVHHIYYTYPTDQTIEIKVVDSKKREAFLIFNKSGILLDKRGEKQLINLVFINYDFFKPHRFRNLHNRFVSN